MKQSLKLSSAKSLQKLLSLDEINGSDFKDKVFLQELANEKILHIKQVSAKKIKILLLNKDRLYNYLDSKFDIKDIDSFIDIFSKQNISRNALSKVTNDTKSKSTKVQKGIYLNVLESLSLKIDGEFCRISPMPNGSIFIHHLSKIKLQSDILIVIVENFENLLLINKQRYLFENIDKKVVFIFRNRALYSYLKNLHNEIIYFGDIDLAGISIFLNEIQSKFINKSSFFVPKNIETLLQNSNAKLYFKQYEKYKNLQANEEYLTALINLLHRYKKSVEQEFLIEDN